MIMHLAVSGPSGHIEPLCEAQNVGIAYSFAVSGVTCRTCLDKVVHLSKVVQLPQPTTESAVGK
jgi:hypothetical protein